MVVALSSGCGSRTAFGVFADGMVPVCGNGVLEVGEVCDDGNTISGDGCAADCGSDEACGNGIVDVAAGEECDDGNGVGGDGCGLSCLYEYCGNGVLDPGEVCDDGNVMAGDGCSPNCLSDETCGNGVVDTIHGEQCDEGEDNSDEPGAVCRTDCRWQRCGNGVVDGVMGEGCDDGNLVDGDGCSGCLVDPGWWCHDAPSLCCPLYWQGPDCMGPCVVYVDGAAQPVQPDGASWATAFAAPQQGVDAALGAGPGCEVWVAGGHYAVWQSAATDTLELRNGTALYGGFAGTEAVREQRDWTAHPTVLDGQSPVDPADRVYHVVDATGLDGAHIDGFEITGGDATEILSWNGGSGGGLAVRDSTMLVENCTFTLNGGYFGGGIGAVDSSVEIRRSVFRENNAEVNGGAVYSRSASELKLIDCHFERNSAHDGGAVYHETTPPNSSEQRSMFVFESVFVDNSAGHGGAVTARYTDGVSIESSVFMDKRDHADIRPSAQVSGVGHRGSRCLLWAAWRV